MRRIRLLHVTSLALAVVGSLLAAPHAQATASVVTVQAGAVHPANATAPYEYTRFYPDTIKVHSGQTVRWKTVGAPNISGFHTITFSKNGRPGFFRTDEAGGYARPERQILGSSCGRHGLLPCVLKSSSSFLSSGIPPFGSSPFEVKMDLAPGSYRYFCTIHPGMYGAVQVVKSTARVPTQEQVNAEIAAQVRKDSADADTLFRADQKLVSRIDATGHRVWHVLLGDSTSGDHVSINAYLPTALHIAAGDKVAYVFRDRNTNEGHTVTFPAEAVGSRNPVPHGLGGQGFQISCDFDDPSTGMKGIPGPWEVRVHCPANLEVVYAPWMTQGHPAPGNQVLTRATYHDSGILDAPSAPRSVRVLPDTGRALPSSFEAEFPTAGSFAFGCNIHADSMTGSVTVS